MKSRRVRCWLCGDLFPRDFIIVSLGRTAICRGCDSEIERRPGKIIGREIREGLKAMHSERTDQGNG